MIWVVGRLGSIIKAISLSNRLPYRAIHKRNVIFIISTLLIFQILKMNQSGPDGVAPRILRSVSQCLVSSLTLLFNQSLQCGQLPYIWKRSHVTRAYKNKGVASDALEISQNMNLMSLPISRLLIIVL
jgi:hypothetical protein